MHSKWIVPCAMELIFFFCWSSLTVFCFFLWRNTFNYPFALNGNTVEHMELNALCRKIKSTSIGISGEKNKIGIFDGGLCVIDLPKKSILNYLLFYGLMEKIVCVCFFFLSRKRLWLSTPLKNFLFFSLSCYFYSLN